jgi:hypothetical protein
MSFVKYHKIRRLGTEETEWVLQGEVIVQEKIDWANLSVRAEYGEICIGSRTQNICTKWEVRNWFNWACEYVLKHPWIKKLLTDNPGYRLFGERLHRHTVVYAPQYYNKFRMFDIMTDGTDEDPIFLNPIKTSEIAKEYGIESPHIFWTFTNPTIEQLTEYFTKPQYWDVIEWIVLKNINFINKFWRFQYAKLVSERFKEENKIIFWNANKFDDLELRLALKWTTPWRFLKILNKIEQQQGKNFNEKNIAEILWRVQYDVICEEIPGWVKNEVVNFGKLRKNITNIARVMALWYIEQWENAPIFTYNHQWNESNIPTGTDMIGQDNESTWDNEETSVTVQTLE